MFEAFRWRPVGPFRAGRVSAVAGDPADRLTFYMGAAAGGVWKTANGGISWRNVSDPFFRTPAVGALAVAGSDPQVVYAGTGEANIRTDVAHGSGIYRSADGGASWEPAGLDDSRHIGRLAIDPTDAQVVFAAALGHIYGPGGQRGVYRTDDGGRSWAPVLPADGRSGAIDLAMDPNSPQVLYAALWQVRRTPYSIESGGPATRLCRTEDGGAHWDDLTGQPGLPAGPLGRIGLAISAAPHRLWASIEAREGGIFRSDDDGAHWERVSAAPALTLRPWYFSRLTADPLNGEGVYVQNLDLWRSADGGRTFDRLPTPHADHHDLWVDPRDPHRLISGHDGGAAVSYDGGASWSSTLNQPTGQFYHVTADEQIPYRIYGAQQDNSTLSVPSRTSGVGITLADCYSVGGGESGAIAVRPDNAHIVYAGSNGSILTRYHHPTRTRRVITPWPEEVRGAPGRDLPYRFAWSFPVVLSPHDPETLYVGANVLFRSRDEGRTWDVISPDLTRHDKATLGPSGGPITGDNGHAELYATLATVAASPRDPNVLWAGSDDGLIHVTRDGGRRWQNVTPAHLPEWAAILAVEASPHDPAAAYAAASRHRLDDLTPYVLKTHDFGVTWQMIAEGVAPDDFARVIRADLERPGLLFLGTESGVYTSLDDGEHWRPFQQNLPRVPIYDLKIHHGDLIAATHGRSFWIADDVAALRRIAEHRADQEPLAPILAPPPPTPRFCGRGAGALPPAQHAGCASTDTALVAWEPVGDTATLVNAGANPAPGMGLTLFLPTVPTSSPRLRISDAEGALLHEFAEGAIQPVRGSQRVVWDMRYPGPTPLPGAVYRGGGERGPLAPPGAYWATLTVGGAEVAAELTIVPDPRLPPTPEDAAAQFQLCQDIVGVLSRLNEAVLQVRELRRRLPTEGAQLDAIEDALIQRHAKVPLDYLKYPPGPNVKLAALMQAVDGSDGPPIAAARLVLDRLTAAVDAQVRQLQKLAGSLLA